LKNVFARAHSKNVSIFAGFVRRQAASRWVGDHEKKIWVEEIQ
jgi:hypothetical protein